MNRCACTSDNFKLILYPYWFHHEHTPHFARAFEK